MKGLVAPSRALRSRRRLLVAIAFAINGVACEALLDLDRGKLAPVGAEAGGTTTPVVDSGKDSADGGDGSDGATDSAMDSPEDAPADVAEGGG